jgi:hypothetical protein
MKKSILLVLVLFISTNSFTQKNWFTVYTDSTSLVNDGNEITKQFIADVKKINPDLKFEVTTVLNTTPYLIYFDPSGTVKTANLPIWSQVITEQKQFFYEVAGSEMAGKEAFGYFFNGFYLPHELAHALQDAMEGNVPGSYENEYFANVVAMLWWKKHGNQAQLDQCYESAKTMWKNLKSPVPSGVSLQEYLRTNYEQASSDPYVYGYIQFAQFIMIYEDTTLPAFDEFVGSYLKK